MDKYPAGTPDGAPDGAHRAPDVEMFEADASGRLTPVVTGGSTGARGRSLLSVPGAVAGALLVTALAFGAGGFRPALDDSDATPKPATEADPARATDAPAQPGGLLGSEGGEGGAPTAKPSTDDGKPTAWPTAKPVVEATAKPTDKPTDKPAPTQAPIERMNLALSVSDGRVVLDWTACPVDGFAYYKVVRSTDGKVTWPMGDNDTLVAAIEDRGTTLAKDAKAPAGTQLWYKVFGVAEVGGKLVARCLSTLEAVTVPGADPTTKPDGGGAGSMTLAASIKDGHPYLKWSACTSDAFAYYKIVWSKDGTVTWPAGDNDVVAGAIGDRSATAFWDKAAPGGKTLTYRVFCVTKSDGAYKVLAATPAKSVTTPAPEPPPAPVTLGFSVSLTEGGVTLDWESCTSDGFVYYKVIRSQGSNPSYLPWTDGSEVIGVIESAGNSAFGDSSVSSGQTWHYRIQAIGKWNGQKVVLGQTPVLQVTIP